MVITMIPSTGCNKRQSQKQQNAQVGTHFHRSLRMLQQTKENPGIVMCAGGFTYFPMAVAAIKNLRRLGCKLPIEIVYAGQDEFGKPERKLIKGLKNVTTIACDQKDRGFQLKAKAVQLCSFNPVMLLDADCLWFRDPTFLFKESAFTDTGAMFWPDMVDMNAENIFSPKVWDLLNLSPKLDERQQESSCVVIDKQRHADSLSHTYKMNENHTFWYKLLHGDKDTWRLGCMLADKPYHMIRHAPGAIGTNNIDSRVFLQHAPDGSPLYVQCHKGPLQVTHMTDSARWWANRLYARDSRVIEIPRRIQKIIVKYNQDLRKARKPYTQVPMMLHRTLLFDDDFPIQVKFMMKRFRDRCWDWERTQWNDEQVRSLMNDHQLSVYDNYDKWIQKADFARYVILDKLGGCYADFDMLGRKDLTRLMMDQCPGKTCIMLEEKTLTKSMRDTSSTYPIRQGKPEDSLRVANYFFICTPGHPVMKKILLECYKRANLPVQSHYDVLYTTGPDVVSTVIHEMKRDGTLSSSGAIVVPKSISDKYVKHSAVGSWRV